MERLRFAKKRVKEIKSKEKNRILAEDKNEYIRTKAE